MNVRLSAQHFLAPLFCGVAGLMIGCREQPRSAAVATNVIATVGSTPITVTALQAELRRRSSGGSAGKTDPQTRQRALEDLIQAEAMYQKALAAGYAQDPQIMAALKTAIITKYQEDQLAKLPPVQLSNAELTNYYQQHPERFGMPEKFRAAIIELRLPQNATAEKRAEAIARATAIRQEALAVANSAEAFGALAQQYSEDQATRYRGGDLGWLAAGATNTGLPSEVIQAVANLNQPRAISPVIETGPALYLVKLVERKPAALRPFGAVQDGVAFQLTRERERQREQQLNASATQGLSIHIDQARLEQVAVPSQTVTPPAFPGGVAEAPPRKSP